MNDGYISVLDSISSDSPTPGGGTVAALTLSHAHSLAEMVARLTIGKNKWSTGQEIAEKIISYCTDARGKSLMLAKEDSDAFTEVMSAYRLSKSNLDEIELRKNAILSATIGAASTPLSIAIEGHKLLLQLPELGLHGNSNAITDLAAASELAYTSVYIAYLNVKINVDSVKDPELDEIQEKAEEILSESKILIHDIRLIVSNRME
jgi:formiminotetrahydrofolate cyclodeaminase